MRRSLLLLVLLHGLVACALSPKTDLDTKQYVHTVWGVDKGYTGGRVYAFAQSDDGYLWLGTERGLIRFDGYSFTPVQPKIPEWRSGGAVRSLVRDGHGNLWIRFDGPRVLRYLGGTFEDAVAKYSIPDVAFTAMSKDAAGNLLLWGPQRKTLSFLNDHFEHRYPPDSIDGIVITFLHSQQGPLWMATRDAGLYRTNGTAISKVLSEAKLRSVNALVPSSHGGIWIGAETGLHLYEGGKDVPDAAPIPLNTAQVFALLQDSHQNLWVGTEAGLYQFDPVSRRIINSWRSQGDSAVSAIYEDDEGDIWFAGSGGVERLRKGMFTSIIARHLGLPELGGPIFEDEDGQMWFGPKSGGLYRLAGGELRRCSIPDIGNDVLYSIHGSRNELWLGRQRGGLTHLTKAGGAWTAQTFTRKDGLAQNSVYTVTRAHDGSVWAGTVSGGLSVLRHGKFTNYTVESGLRSNAIFSSLERADGTMWFSSPSGLVSFDGVRWNNFSVREMESAASIRTVFEDSDKVLWIGTSHGIARLLNGRIIGMGQVPQPLTEETLNINQDDRGFLWIVTSQHVVQVNRAKLLAGTLSEAEVLSYEAEDGLAETHGIRRDRSLVKDSSGRILVSLSQTLGIADPGEAGEYSKPVGVRIDSVAVEGEPTQSRQRLSLPAGTHSIALRYSSTSLSLPQRTQFRFMLDGLEKTWSSDAMFRQVVYTHLTPGQYTFRILASNGLGEWNGPETKLSFRIAPALWQTWYFQILAGVAVVTAGIIFYRRHVVQVTRQLDLRFQDRLAERTRIAQDLHDTLLQGVLSASMQLDLAQEKVAEESDAKPKLRRVLQLLRQVTEEARDALRGLRSGDVPTDLQAAFTSLIQDVHAEDSTARSVQVLGSPRPLQPAVLDQTYWIGREAYLNAIAHAHASRVELALEYGARTFRLTVKDNGCGISRHILRDGRDGHWGLIGMRERAATIGSRLKIRTRAAGGTEVELTVPADIAHTSTGRSQKAV